MTARAYYNEFDPFAAAWLRELITAGAIAPGDVDDRSIADVTPADLVGYTQCHFFAGIGGWSAALRLAGWPDDRPIWTGSCPCQSFSAAGKGLGTADPRHLWPAWARLIRECRPPVVMGEQVSAAIRHGWWDAVQTDLEGSGYACGMGVFGAHSVGAPHIRQRLWFVAESEGEQRHRSRDTGHGGRELANGGAGELAHAECGAAERRRHNMGTAPDGVESEAQQRQRLRPDAGDGESVERVAHAEHPERRPQCFDRVDGCDGSHTGRTCGEVHHLADPTSRGQRIHGGTPRYPGHVDECGTGGGVGDAHHPRSQGRGCDELPTRPGEQSPWAADSLVWLPCRDGKWRPTQSLVQPLADGVCADLGYVRDAATGQAWLSPLTTGTSHRAGRLKGYGNAINPYVAATVIAAYMEVAE